MPHDEIVLRQAEALAHLGGSFSAGWSAGSKEEMSMPFPMSSSFSGTVIFSRMATGMSSGFCEKLKREKSIVMRSSKTNTRSPRPAELMLLPGEVEAVDGVHAQGDPGEEGRVLAEQARLRGVGVDQRELLAAHQPPPARPGPSGRRPDRTPG